MTKTSIALVACGFLAGCSGCEEQPAPSETPTPTVATPEPSAPETPDPSPEADEALRAALLGLDDDADAGAEAPEPEPEPEPEPPAKMGLGSSGRAARRPAPDSGGIPLPPPPGGLSDGEFNLALSDWRGVRTCLATEQVRGTGTRNGALRVAFTISDDGSVSAAKVVDASNGFARSLGPCVERQALRVQFPSFEGPPEVEKTAKFVF